MKKLKARTVAVMVLLVLLSVTLCLAWLGDLCNNALLFYLSVGASSILILLIGVAYNQL
jgi:hypothetical protein